MKANAYNFSNDLARIGGALKNAFIGSASDDANIALAKYRDSQTEGQNLTNRAMSGNLDAIDAAANGNILPTTVARAMNFDVDNGNLIERVNPGDAQMSVPALGVAQKNMDSGALMTELSNISRSMFGDGTSNANQLSQMLNNLGKAGANRLAESMILGGTNDQAGRGALLMSPAGGKYQNPSSAPTEIANDLSAALDKNAKTLDGTMYTADQDLAGDKFEDNLRFGDGGQNDRDNIRNNATTKELGLDLNAAKERWANYKSDQEKLSTDNKTEVDAGVARDKNQMANETARYKHDNRTVEFSVEPGKIIVVDPVSAKKANIPIQTEGKYEGLHILDGGLNLNNGVKVTVGQADVIVTKEVAEALGIPKVNGQYRVKGAGYNSGSSTSGSSGSSDFTVSPSDDKALREFIVGQDTDGAIEGMSNASTIMNELVKMSVAAMGNKKNIPNAKAFITEKLSKGFVDLVVPIPMAFDDKFKVPVYLIDEINGNTGNQANDQKIQTLKAQSPDQWRETATAVLSEHGFSADRIAIILGQ